MSCFVIPHRAALFYTVLHCITLYYSDSLLNNSNFTVSVSMTSQLKSQPNKHTPIPLHFIPLHSSPIRTQQYSLILRTSQAPLYAGCWSVHIGNVSSPSETKFQLFHCTCTWIPSNSSRMHVFMLSSDRFTFRV